MWSGREVRWCGGCWYVCVAPGWWDECISDIVVVVGNVCGDGCEGV